MVARIGLAGAKPANIYFREWREWKLFTQQELADRMETTAATVSRVETGERDWSKGYLEAFAYVIGCPNVVDPISRPPPGHDTRPSIDEMMREASLEKQKQILLVVEALLKTGT